MLNLIKAKILLFLFRDICFSSRCDTCKCNASDAMHTDCHMGGVLEQSEKVWGLEGDETDDR